MLSSIYTMAYYAAKAGDLYTKKLFLSAQAAKSSAYYAV